MAKKKNLESTFINMVLVLLGVTLISSAALGFVFIKTKDRIAAAQQLKKNRAIQEVVVSKYVPGKKCEIFIGKQGEGKNKFNNLECFLTKKDGQLASIAIKTYSKKAFSGEIWVIVGFLPDETINKIAIIEQKETPGLGTKITEPKFKNQYVNKNPQVFNLKVKKDGGDVDAITAATISSRAVSDAVERAYLALQTLKGK